MLNRSLRPRLRPDDLDTSLKPEPATGDAATRATETVRMSEDTPVLLGTFGNNADRQALLRLSQGATMRVRVGDTVEGGEIVAIGEGSIVVADAGRALRLKIPG